MARTDRVHSERQRGAPATTSCRLWPNAAVTAGPGVLLLDRTSDADHNRSVFTFLGDGRRPRRGDDGARRARRSRRSTSGRTGAPTRASAPST